MSLQQSAEAKHTPGPWFVHDNRDLNGNWWIGPGKFDTVAEVRHGHDDIPGDVQANARLIAAAPDLLKALEPFAAAYDAYVNVMQNFVATGGTEAERRFSDGERMDAATEAAYDVLDRIGFDKLADARAAISKATQAQA